MSRSSRIWQAERSSDVGMTRTTRGWDENHRKVQSDQVELREAAVESGEIPVGAEEEDGDAAIGGTSGRLLLQEGFSSRCGSLGQGGEARGGRWP